MSQVKREREGDIERWIGCKSECGWRWREGLTIINTSLQTCYVDDDDTIKTFRFTTAFFAGRESEFSENLEYFTYFL